MFAIPACPSCRTRCVIPCMMLLFTALGLMGCASSGSSHEQVRMIPSSRGFVLPGDEARAAQLMAGLAEPGSDFGPFSGRSDEKMALDPAAGEKFEDAYAVSYTHLTLPTSDLV